MNSGGLPAADVEITIELVTALLQEQHPDLADLPIRELANGWDNVLYRLGDEFTVRLPRRVEAAELVGNEIRWLPELAPRLPLAIPSPVRTGQPTSDYPYAWTVLPWFDGETVGTSTFQAPEREARRLGHFLSRLHRPAPADAPVNPHRGTPLATRDRLTVDRLASLDRSDSAAILAIWADAVAANPWNGPPLWVHGDLHALNIIKDNDALAAILDFGDICSGDPATDLMVAWYLFTQDEREVLRASADSQNRPIDDDMWRRGRGWAVTHALALLVHAADAPALGAIAEKCIAAAIEDLMIEDLAIEDPAIGQDPD
ncbi:MAG: aminoglycoside phosphotransferase family protein [Acidimicrobiales bacterium]